MSLQDQNSWPEIPGYELKGIAGLGGGGIVYRAVESNSGRTVAVKSMLRPDRTEKLNRFRNEARILANLEHPHILPVFDFGVIDERPFLVTRFAQGGSIADRLEWGPIPLDKAVEWVIDIAEALEWAHLQGLLHRDVKPSNMLLDETDQVYLADFGLAGSIDDEELSRAGSALYLSPERGEGKAKIDVTADVYSLGVSLFEMATGRPPYVGDSSLAIRVMHIEEEVPSAREINPEISFAINDLIQWSMAKDPAERPPSAATFAAAARVALKDPDQKVRLPSYLNLDTAPVVPSLESDFPPTVRDTGKVGPPLKSRVPPSTPPGRGRFIWLSGIVLLVTAAVVAWLLFPAPENPGFELTQEIPTPLPAASATPVGRFYFDDFSEPATSIDAIDEARLVNGALEIETTDPQFRIYWPTESVRSDRVNVSLEWLPSDRHDQIEFGILCRWRTIERFEGLVLVVENERVLGQVWRVRAGDVEILAEEPIDPEAIRRDRLHQVTARCLSDRYQLEIDGQTVISFVGQPDGFERGDVAVLARTQIEEKSIFRIDNLLVEAP